MGDLEKRAGSLEVTANARRLEGYAAVFNVETRVGSFNETILPGAFKAALAGDIIALADHDQTRVLGRTKSNTLRLNEDSHGLAFSLDVPETQAGRDLLALAERGDLGGMSFGFTIPKGGDSWSGSKRELRTIGLREISIVSAWPAYPQTTVAARSHSGATDAEKFMALMMECAQ